MIRLALIAVLAAPALAVEPPFFIQNVNGPRDAQGVMGNDRALADQINAQNLKNGGTVDGSITLSGSGSGYKFTDGTSQTTAGKFVAQASSITINFNSNNHAAVPSDDTIPQINEGLFITSRTYTLTNSANSLIIIGHFNGGETANNCTQGALSLFKDGGADAVRSAFTDFAGATEMRNISLYHVDSPGDTSEHTYSLRVGCGAANTAEVNGVGGVRRYGGVVSSGLHVIEVGT